MTFLRAVQQGIDLKVQVINTCSRFSIPGNWNKKEPEKEQNVYFKVSTLSLTCSIFRLGRVKSWTCDLHFQLCTKYSLQISIIVGICLDFAKQENYTVDQVTKYLKEKIFLCNNILGEVSWSSKQVIMQVK